MLGRLGQFDGVVGNAIMLPLWEGRTSVGHVMQVRCGGSCEGVVCLVLCGCLEVISCPGQDSVASRHLQPLSLPVAARRLGRHCVALFSAVRRCRHHARPAALRGLTAAAAAVDRDCALTAGD